MPDALPMAPSTMAGVMPLDSDWEAKFDAIGETAVASDEQGLTEGTAEDALDEVLGITQ